MDKIVAEIMGAIVALAIIEACSGAVSSTIRAILWREKD